MEYPDKIWCNGCENTTPHNPKLDAVSVGNLVCKIGRKENKFGNMEKPENWVVVKIVATDAKPIYKVFASWFGGYLDGDRWKMNSGIRNVVNEDDTFHFHGYSGSIYKCQKGAYGTGTSFTSGILDNVMNKTEESGFGTIEILPETTNWMELIK